MYCDKSKVWNFKRNNWCISSHRNLFTSLKLGFEPWNLEHSEMGRAKYITPFDHILVKFKMENELVSPPKWDSMISFLRLSSVNAHCPN